MKFYQSLDRMECLQGDTIQTFHVDVENVADFPECVLIIEDAAIPGAVVLQKSCIADETGFSVQLTSDETKEMSGLYRYHFCLTDSSGLKYRKLSGTLDIIPTAQGV